ncbi:unnamed protein product [Arctogadus glacialis]
MAAVNTVATNHKTIQVAGSSSTSLPNDLNSFFTRFETDNSTQLADTLTTLKPGRRLRCLGCRTQRRKATFVPKAVHLLNSS